MNKGIGIYVIFLVLVALFIYGGDEGFYIEPSMIAGGAQENVVGYEHDGSDYLYSQPLELGGPGDPAWTSY